MTVRITDGLRRVTIVERTPAEHPPGPVVRVKRSAAPRRCAVCRDPRQAVQHFSLVASIRKADGHPTSHGYGSIDLCDGCREDATRASRIR